MRPCKACGKNRKPAYPGSAYCGPCRNERRRERYASSHKLRKAQRRWVARNRDKVRASNRAYAARVRKNNPALSLWRGAKGRAALKGVPFNLRVEDIVIPERCPVFGFLLEGGLGTRDNSPSLDRFVPSLGYVPGNVNVISHLANQLKNSGTAEQHRRVADWMETQQKESE